MDFEDEEDDPKPEKLPIYQKGKQIFDMVHFLLSSGSAALAGRGFWL